MEFSDSKCICQYVDWSVLLSERSFCKGSSASRFTACSHAWVQILVTLKLSPRINFCPALQRRTLFGMSCNTLPCKGKKRHVVSNSELCRVNNHSRVWRCSLLCCRVESEGFCSNWSAQQHSDCARQPLGSAQTNSNQATEQNWCCESGYNSSCMCMVELSLTQPQSATQVKISTEV
jgi:hypothetical protein